MNTEFKTWLPGNASALSIDVRGVDGTVRVHVSGELDISSVHALSDAVAGIGLDDGREVVLDLSALRFCDAAGVTALLGAHRSIHSAGGRLRVRGASGQPRRVLMLTATDRLLDLE